MCVFPLECGWLTKDYTFGEKWPCLSQQLILPIALQIGWDFVPHPFLHAGFWSNIGLHRFLKGCHKSCGFLCAATLLCRRYCSLVVIHCLWLLHFFCPLFSNHAWVLEGGVQYLCSLQDWAVDHLLFSVPCVDLYIKHNQMQIEASLIMIERCLDVQL